MCPIFLYQFSDKSTICKAQDLSLRFGSKCFLFSIYNEFRILYDIIFPFHSPSHHLAYISFAFGEYINCLAVTTRYRIPHALARETISSALKKTGWKAFANFSYSQFRISRLDWIHSAYGAEVRVPFHSPPRSEYSPPVDHHSILRFPKPLITHINTSSIQQQRAVH